jgi:hypothetical protein
MTSDREIRVVIYRSDELEPERLEESIRLSGGADFPDFIEALKRKSPDLYEEVRRRVMRAAGRVLAYGHDDPLLVAIDQKIAEGGTLIFPAEVSETDAKDAVPAATSDAS